MTAFSALNASPRIRILQFTTADCGVCKSLERNGFFDDVKREFPDVKVVKLQAGDENPEEKAANTLADLYEVKSVPTFVFEVEHVGTVETIEGAGAKASTLKLFGKAVAECRKVAKSLQEIGVVSW